MHMRRAVTVNSDGLIYGSLKWNYTIGGDVLTSPIVDRSGTVYVGSSDNYLYAISANGLLKWRYLTGGEIYSAPAIGYDKTIYFGSWDYYVYAIYSTGSLKWRYQTNGEVWSSAAIDSDENIFVQSNDLYLYAFSSDGSLKWKYQTPYRYNRIPSPLVSSDNTIYIIAGDGLYNDYILAFFQDGKIKWSYNPRYFGADLQTVLGLDDTLYVNTDSYDGDILAISPAGKLKWIYSLSPYPIGAPAISPDDGTIYIGSYSLTVQKISYGGKLLWNYSSPNSVYPSKELTIGSDGIVYIPSSDHSITAVSPQGSVIWQYWAKAAITTKLTIGSDGTVHVGSGNTIYAIYSSSIPSNKTSGILESDSSSVASSVIIVISVVIAVVFCCLLFFGGLFCFLKRKRQPQPSFQPFETPRAVSQQFVAVTQSYDYRHINELRSIGSESEKSSKNGALTTAKHNLSSSSSTQASSSYTSSREVSNSATYIVPQQTVAVTLPYGSKYINALRSMGPELENCSKNGVIITKIPMSSNTQGSSSYTSSRDVSDSGAYAVPVVVATIVSEPDTSYVVPSAPSLTLMEASRNNIIRTDEQVTPQQTYLKPKVSNSVTGVSEEKSNDSISNDTSCIICMDHERTHVIFPCRHASYCLSCLNALDKCAVCSGPKSFVWSMSQMNMYHS